MSAAALLQSYAYPIAGTAGVCSHSKISGVLHSGAASLMADGDGKNRRVVVNFAVAHGERCIGPPDIYRQYAPFNPLYARRPGNEAIPIFTTYDRDWTGF